ncbi:hypothetical protein EDC04DRAFT_1278306 [Pisolithus marmoratus]|nr:hypothetical protein EDC04DRAFT_1278306 [Pisolithus marmoratus]
MQHSLRTPDLFFIGVAISILLCGIIITQTYLYFSAYKGDRLWMKIFIAFLFFANTVSSIFDVTYVRHTFGNHFGDSSWLAQKSWVFATGSAIAGIISGPVQLLFAWKVYNLSRNVFVVFAIVFYSSVGMLGALGTTIAVMIAPHVVAFQKFKAIVITQLASSACADLIIAMALMLHLRSGKDGFPVKSDAIDRVIRMTVQTGLITTLFAVTNLATFLSYDTGILPLAKLHTNSLLSSLNSRGGWGYTKSSEMNNCDQGNPQRGTVWVQSNVCPEVFVHVEEHKLVEMNNRLYSPFGKLSDARSDRSKSGLIHF